MAGEDRVAHLGQQLAHHRRHCRRSRCRPAAACGRPDVRCGRRAAGSRRRARADRHRTRSRAPAHRPAAARRRARPRPPAPPPAPPRCAAAACACAARCGPGRESRRAARRRRPWRCCSASIAGAMASVKAVTRCGAAVPWALAWMSWAKRSALSSCTPAARCTRVPAAGMKPEDSAVEPCGVASRSSSTQSMPASRSAIAAVSPQAPEPTMATGSSGVPGGMAAARTTVGFTTSDGAGTRRAACR